MPGRHHLHKGTGGCGRATQQGEADEAGGERVWPGFLASRRCHRRLRQVPTPPPLCNVLCVCDPLQNDHRLARKDACPRELAEAVAQLPVRAPGRPVGSAPMSPALTPSGRHGGQGVSSCPRDMQPGSPRPRRAPDHTLMAGQATAVLAACCSPRPQPCGCAGGGPRPAGSGDAPQSPGPAMGLTMVQEDPWGLLVLILVLVL